MAEEKWELRKPSNLSEAMNCIFHDASKPVGVVLLGINSKLKEEIRIALIDRMPYSIVTFMDIDDPEGVDDAFGESYQEYFAKGEPVLVVMNGATSVREGRRRITKVLREAGAATVVGIFAEYALYLFPCDIAPGNTALEQAHLQALQIYEYPPELSEGFDYLFTKTGGDLLMPSSSL